jgi:hypothetical protein
MLRAGAASSLSLYIRLGKRSISFHLRLPGFVWIMRIRA